MTQRPLSHATASATASAAVQAGESAGQITAFQPASETVLPNLASTVRPLHAPIAEFWRLLLLASLPISQLVAFRAGGLTVNLVEFLVPVLFAVLLLLLIYEGLRIRKTLVWTGLALGAMLVALFLVSVVVRNESPFFFAKIAFGQIFVFLTYVLFSRSRPEQALRHLQIVCWMGAVAAGITLLAPSVAADGRLDSFLWGRSNAFAAALILTISAGLVGILGYKRYLLLLPILVSLAGVVQTQSRGSLLILLGVAVLMLVARSRNPLQGLGSLLLVGGVAALILFATPPRLWEAVPVVNRLTPQFESLRGYLHDGNEYDKRELLSGRLYVWESAINQIKASPWVGNSVREIYLPRWAGSAVLLVEEDQMSYHSWALNIAAASGLLVLALNVVVLLLALAPYWTERSPVRRMVLVVLLAQVAYGLTEPMYEAGFFALNIVGMLTWILAGIGIALPQPVPRAKASPPGAFGALSLPIDQAP